MRLFPLRIDSDDWHELTNPILELLEQTAMVEAAAIAADISEARGADVRSQRLEIAERKRELLFSELAIREEITNRMRSSEYESRDANDADALGIRRALEAYLSPKEKTTV